MRILTTMLTQDAVLWFEGTADGFGGWTWPSGAPVQIKCRWEDKHEKFFGPDGEETMSRAVVNVDRDIDLEAGPAFLMLGTLEAFEDSSAMILEPDDSGLDAYPVASFEKLPTLKGDEFLRTAYVV